MTLVTIAGFCFAYSKPFSSPPFGSYPNKLQKERNLVCLRTRADALDKRA